MLELFQFDFIQRAFIVGITLGITAPCVGMFLVVRRYSALADTLAHVSLVGVAIGLLTKTQPILMALIVSVLAAAGIEFIRARRNIFAESILTLFLSGGLGIATLLISLGNGLNANLLSYLFGSISTVTATDVTIALAIGASVLTTVTIFYKELFLISFDDELARVQGVPSRTLNYVLIILAAVTIALSMRIIGMLLIGSLMVVPVMSALQFKRGFKTTLGLAIIFSLIAVITGLFASYYMNLASGSTIVVASIGIFLIASLSTRARK